MISTIRQSIMILVAALYLVAPMYEAIGQEAAPDDQSGFTAEDRDVFAPFVSRLRVAVRDPQVRLTWRDAEDLEGGAYRVYRHTREITQDTFAAATMIAEVPAGTETYLDTPLEEGQYYYAVIATDGADTIYPIFVPFRNKTIRSVTVAQLETEEDLAARVYDIEALVQDNAVVVRFETSRGGRNLVVYRSTAPLRSEEDILAATRINEFESTTRRFADYPVPGVDYYYAVIDKALIERGSIALEPGDNTLAEAVRIGLSDVPTVQIQFPQATKRQTPLPILHIAQDIRTGERLANNPIPQRSDQPLRRETESALEYLLTRTPEPDLFRPQPVVLPEERTDDGEGAERTLTQVIQTEFTEGRYASTADLLRNLLTLPLSNPLEQRTRFYLGQALYFDGRMEPAFMEFLLAADGTLYSHVRPWIDGILSSRG